MARVEIEGVGIVDFPDEMSQEQIANAIEKELVPQLRRDRVRANARRAYTSMSTGQKLAAGFARPFMELGYGIEDLAGKVGIGDGKGDARVAGSRSEGEDNAIFGIGAAQGVTGGSR